MASSSTRRRTRRSRRGKGRGRKIRIQTHYEQHPSYYLTQQGGSTKITDAHLKILRRASQVIRDLDRELKVGVGQTQLLKRAVSECAAANSAVVAKLRAISKELSSGKRASKGNQATMKGAAQLQQLTSKLTKTLEESQQLWQGLRQARNELGEAQDEIKRARAETEDLRGELRRAGAARAEEALRPLADEIRALRPQIAAIQQSVREFREGVDWRRWRPGTGEMARALDPVYLSLSIDAPGQGPTVLAANAPPEVQRILQVIADKFTAALPRNLGPQLQTLDRELRTLQDSVTASLRAVERVPGDARGGGKRTMRKRQGHRGRGGQTQRQRRR